MIKIETGTDYAAYFSLKTGFLVKYVSSFDTISSEIKFIRYESEGSGAYLFVPNGPALDIESDLNLGLELNMADHLDQEFALTSQSLCIVLKFSQH